MTTAMEKENENVDKHTEKMTVHRVRFFTYQPQTINCIAKDELSDRVAVSRSDGTVEIFGCKDNWMQEMSFSGGSDTSVESMVWCQGRLFAGGISGNIVELDLQTRKPKVSVSSNAGPIWCLTKNSKGDKIAAGTEDGCVVLFDVSDELQFSRGFAKQEGRILSLAWFDQDGEDIVISGGVNGLRQWSVKSGQPISRMTLGRVHYKDTIVWAVTVTKDFTIVSGDSRGIITFWNGKEATQLKTFHCHKADVLSLCLSDDDTQLYSGSVDGRLFQFTLCAADHTTERRRWVHQPLHSKHTHDVRAVAYCGNFLVSGGVDTNLYVSRIKGSKSVMKVFSGPKPGQINISRERNLIQLQYSDRIELWRLGAANTPFAEERGKLPLTRRHQNLLQLKARPGCQVTCSAIAADASVLAYSDTLGTRLFRLNLNEESAIVPQISLEKLTSLNLLTPAHLMALTCDGSHLVSSLTSGEVVVADLTSGKINQVERRATDPPIHRLCVSPDGRRFAIASLDHAVHVYNLATCQVEFSCPVQTSQVSAMAFSPHSPTLVVAYCNHSIYEFDLERCELTEWSRKYSGRFPTNWLRPLRYITGVAFVPDSPSKILVHHETVLSIIDKTKTSESLSREHLNTEKAASSCYKYEYLLFAEFLSNGTLAVVEQPPLHIEDNLPPSFKQKRFGVS